MSPQDQLEAPPLRLAVLESGDARSGWRVATIGDQIRFDTEGLESYCFAASRPEVYDLILVAAAVELCDKSRRRPRHGWNRCFELDIPVHDLTRWQSPAVANGLRDALEFLTGDTWDLHFRSRMAPVEAPASPMLPLLLPVGAVMPYSDGLDSRAVAKLMEDAIEGRLVRVRLGPINDPDGFRLFAKVPFTVTPLDGSVESSGRSRAFKFTAMAGIAAALSGTSRIIMTESFQGAIGPVLVPVAHAYDDYRNHPLFTDRMATFLGALFGQSFRFEYPRLWSTKSETIREAMSVKSNSSFNWSGTRSCWQDNRHVSLDGRRRQCGICAACMLRRMSLHAAGLCDPEGTFVWEDLNAPTFTAAASAGFNPKKITRAQREYAIAGLLHMDHLADLPRQQASDGELAHAAFRLARPLELTEAEAASRITAVLDRHRKEWRGFVGSLGRQSFLRSWLDGDQP